jgi:Na+/proline symporter
VQFYFGLPLAMVVICVAFIPVFSKLNVYTAYEYLEKRFDNKTRSLTAFLFLLQRGLSTGITIYAPAIILSTILGVSITYTTLFMGAAVILYTVYGGTKAVSYTQMLQMTIIFAGLFFAGYMVVHLLPKEVGFLDALHIAGKMGKMNAIDTKFDWNNRYNLWSGIIGGFFLQLSYFGTDQSQVGRYLTGKSIAQSRIGLVMNGLIKIPMQFLILLIGILVFAFYQFHTPPVFFNKVEVESIRHSAYTSQYDSLQKVYSLKQEEKRVQINEYIRALHEKDKVKEKSLGADLKISQAEADTIRKKTLALVRKNSGSEKTNDTDYVFLSFVMEYLPVGLVGLLIAIIFLAAMGSTASGLNSLASTTIVDFYKRFHQREESESYYLAASRWATVLWGVFCVVVAFFASRLGDNLIEVVNILGSFFYGTILGIFLVAFWMKNVKGTAVFYAALITEMFVIAAWYFNLMAFLWLNVLGCLLLMILAAGIQYLFSRNVRTRNP